MAKWEYLRVYASYKCQTGKAVHINSNGLVIFDDYKNPTNIYDYLNQLGKDGWEEINILQLSTSQDANLAVEIVFKRPLNN